MSNKVQAGQQGCKVSALQEQIKQKIPEQSDYVYSSGIKNSVTIDIS